MCKSKMFFLAKIYNMYDGQEFPALDVCSGFSQAEALEEFEKRCKEGNYSHGDIESKDEYGYWSYCGAQVVRVKSVTPIPEAVYQVLKNF